MPSLNDELDATRRELRTLIDAAFKAGRKYGRGRTSEEEAAQELSDIRALALRHVRHLVRRINGGIP